MGILSDIKKAVETSGKARKGMWFVKEGNRRRVRFLQDFEKATTIPWHQLFKDGTYQVNTPCLELYGKVCPFCENSDLKNAPMYAWTVWDYEAKERQVFMFKVSRASPIPHLVEVYETKGTLLGRDLLVAKKGQKQDTVYIVSTEDPSKSEISAKPFKHDELIKLIWDANGTGSLKKDYEDADEEEEDEEEEDIEEEDEEELDEEEESEDDDEEEEEEPEPVRKKAKPKTKAKPVVKAKKRR